MILLQVWRTAPFCGARYALVPSTNSTCLEMLAPKSHTSFAKMDLRRMKEGAMWRTGYVDIVNLRSHTPTMKIR